MLMRLVFCGEIGAGVDTGQWQYVLMNDPRLALVSPSAQRLIARRILNGFKAAYARAASIDQVVLGDSPLDGDARLETLPVFRLIIVDSIFLVNLILRLLLLLLLILLLMIVVLGNTGRSVVAFGQHDSVEVAASLLHQLVQIRHHCLFILT